MTRTATPFTVKRRRRLRWRRQLREESRTRSLRGRRNVILPGQYYDVETGLTYNAARYYDAQLGRYIQSDPIGLAGGLNTYSYARSSPLRHRDVRGLATEEDDEDVEEEEERWESSVARVHVDEVVDQIRQYDPAFQYATLARPDYRLQSPGHRVPERFAPAISPGGKLSSTRPEDQLWINPQWISF